MTRVLLAEPALRRAVRHAGRSTKREVGGVLIGVRIGDDVVVEDVVAVDDPSSTRTRFRLRHQPREDAIATYLARLPADSELGYVGTWHSHLADAAPSLTDRRTFHRELWSAPDAVAMVVFASQTDGGWRPYGLVGRPRLMARTCEVEVF